MLNFRQHLGLPLGDLTDEADTESDDLDISTSFFEEPLQPQPQKTHSNPLGSFSKLLYEGAPNDLTEYMGHILLC